MNLNTFLDGLKIDHNSKVTIAVLLTNEDAYRQKNPNYMKSISMKHFRRFASGHEVPNDFTFYDDPVPIMETLNYMVKDKSCPSNYKNRFYKYKTIVLKKCIKEGRVTKALDCGHFIELTVDGKYVFHQIKDFGYNGWIADGRLKFDGTAVYERNAEPQPFSSTLFRDFQVSAVNYAAQKSQA